MGGPGEFRDVGGVPGECGESDDEWDSWDDGVCLDKIEPGDHVVIFCTGPDDPCALALPGPSSQVTQYVFLAAVKTTINKKDPKKASFKGYFYFNAAKDATEALTRQSKTQTITIRETSVLEIYEAAKCGEVMDKLTTEEIEGIVEFLATHD